MSRAVSHIAISMACIALIAGSAWGQEAVPLTCPFVKVIETDDDVSWVDVRRITGITLVPDHKYRNGENWYGHNQGRRVRENAEEVREQWKVAFVGTGIEARYATQQEAASAVNRVLTTARDRQWQ